MTHIFNWRPDLTDHRDFKYKKRFRLFLPETVDLRPFCSPVENQEKTGSCTAQALVGNMELIDRKQDNNYTDLSRLFLYYNERKIEGTINMDCGAFLRSGIKALKKYGICVETLHPFKLEAVFTEPTESAYENALTHKIQRYERLGDLSDILACLAEQSPVVCGISIYESFETAAVEATGNIPMPEKDETMLGGHAIMIVGYNHYKRLLICRNSWGVNWGDLGYFYLPYAYIKKYGSDFWTIRS